MKVLYTAAALFELKEIGRYIAERNPQAALKVERAIRRAVRTLATMPKRGRKQRSRDIWKIGVGQYPYSIYYQIGVTSQVVTIVTIRHAARRQKHGNT